MEWIQNTWTLVVENLVIFILIVVIFIKLGATINK